MLDKKQGNSEFRSSVEMVTIDHRHEGQRIDNFLMNHLKGVPRNRIYRIIRKGEVRVNKKRAQATYRLSEGDVVRVPPVTLPSPSAGPKSIPSSVLETLSKVSLYEDESLWVINKPAGLAVHAGTGSHFGVIDGLRALRPELTFLELAHRLDRETSGCLVLAKTRATLTHLHEQIRHGDTEKNYMALLAGRLQQEFIKVEQALLSNQLQSGERMVIASDSGKPAQTHIELSTRFEHCSLVDIRLLTGRKHQIRVHAAHIGHAVIGDTKYGDKSVNRKMQKYGVTRLMLHASAIRFELDRSYAFSAPVPDDMSAVIEKLPK